MFVLPSTNHLDHAIPLELSEFFLYGESQTIPRSSSTDFQNHSRSSLAFKDNSSKEEILCFFINL